MAIRTGDHIERNDLLGRLADIQYSRNDIDFQRGTFRVRGDCIELHPSYESFAIRIEYFGDEIDDTVTNGFETVRLTALLRDKAGYRYMEDLGTEPRVYYLPPANRMFPFEDDPSMEAG